MKDFVKLSASLHNDVLNKGLDNYTARRTGAVHSGRGGRGGNRGGGGPGGRGRGERKGRGGGGGRGNGEKSKANTPPGKEEPGVLLYYPDGSLYCGNYRYFKDFEQADKDKINVARKAKQASGKKRKASALTSSVNEEPAAKKPALKTTPVAQAPTAAVVTAPIKPVKQTQRVLSPTARKQLALEPEAEVVDGDNGDVVMDVVANDDTEDEAEPSVLTKNGKPNAGKLMGSGHYIGKRAKFVIPKKKGGGRTVQLPTQANEKASKSKNVD